MLTIATQYSRYPGPRFAEDGPFSGEVFRDEHLVPALVAAEREGKRLIVELDGARGYTASFLEEAFGGLIRVRGYTLDRVSKLLDVRAQDRRVSYWRDRIQLYMEKAAAVSERV